MPIDTQKYDRQLRLWATTGQQSLATSHVCLVNANTLGCEVLKNLVLPGIGKFTIVDAEKVTQDDLSANFFLKASSLGEYRAEAAKNVLLELNPDVAGEAVTAFRDDGAFWKQFSLVVVSNQFCELGSLKERLWKWQVPLMVVNSVGFYGSLRVFAAELTAIESHPANPFGDLRLDKPWPELQRYVDAISLPALDLVDHAHVPYVVILIKALKEWRKLHAGGAPESSQEKREFKEGIARMARNIHTEVNFTEARDVSWRACQVTETPAGIHELMDLSRTALHAAPERNRIFWVLVSALRLFQKEAGTLPLSGVLPDMASDTASYVRLQDIYRAKARLDRLRFKKHVAAVLLSLEEGGEVSDEVAETFCKNARTLFVARSSNTDDLNTELVEILTRGESPGAMQAEYEDEGLANLYVYLSLLANTHHYNTRASAATLPDLYLAVREVLGSVHIPAKLDQTLQEVVRAQNREFHNTSSLMGGMAGQEALKVLMAQYRVLDNCFVWDGIKSRSDKWKV
ncbi:hypothetical protein BABINDRAFT_162022 [Babjeviella inositovora NRRL Y-12698]|uniref:NEDD8-activating enzyme E1 regulatory subunit n=1 Tax=Babjeviella inositovora NRRL Y-12698 TaxID=984486 RepID=A0A1E3QPL0_9ASCO|nr:uncharacterized protein BABINDRAFT_162022 [Babjeviella inositovora NRRL Y-12698]ODQ79646.1 hypothetical protein BABINDRAFT_162022 [Babjeviella inositovora NRRL Y-12698]